MLEALEKGGGPLPPASMRWRRLLLDPDPSVRLQAEKFCFEGLYGRATPTDKPPTLPMSITVDISRDGADVEVSADPDAASPEDPEDLEGGRWEVT